MKSAGWAVLGVVSLVFAGHVATGCVGDDPAVTGGGGNDAGGGGPTLATNGTACGAGTECTSGNCVDGVCCESACGGTCEACNLPGQLGTCAAVPEGQDPATECPTTPLGDAGTDPGDADPDAAPFALPADGVTTTDTQCAGSCNGQRACGFPGITKTCGSVFCGNSTTQGRAACDGKGHCLFGTEDCKSFACPDGTAGCKATCASEADCQPGFFCEVASSTCKAKLGNGTTCQSASQCQTGFCVDSVCCNDACSYAGGKCNAVGSLGQCKCGNCAANDTCQLFYRDEDGDGYGDMNGTLVNLRAQVGCASAPPAGFVADHTDCWDGPSNTAAKDVHPGQTAFFSTSYTIPGGVASFDYDCNGKRETLVPEILSGTCGFCGPFFSNPCTKVQVKCTEGRQQYLACAYTKNRTCEGTTSGFTTTVTCGTTGTRVSCGACASGLVTGGGSTPNVLQKCH